MFYVGQKVVCVNDCGLYGNAAGRLETFGELTVGAIYTVRWSGIYDGTYCVQLVEVDRTQTKAPEPLRILDDEDVPFNASRFRPLVERKTDISIFKKLLTPSPEKEVLETTNS